MKLSLVVPCYNEQGNVNAFFEQSSKVFDKMNYDYEFVFVNDGSRDKTLDNLKKLYSEKHEYNIKIVNFSRNFGKESAIYAGMENSCGDYVSIIDADLQQRPEIVADMVKILDENDDYDCVAAYQHERNEGKVLKFFKDCFYKLINKISDVDFVEGASDFRTCRRQVIEAVLGMKEYHRFSKGIFSWVGFNTHYMPYNADERFSGTTKWSFWKLTKYAIEGIVAFTTTPLRIATIVGSISAIFSFIYLIIVVIQKLFFSINVPGYATLVVLITFFGGMQLLSMGILGEYIARMFIQNKERPIYIAKEVLTYEKNDSENKKSED